MKALKQDLDPEPPGPQGFPAQWTVAATGRVNFGIKRIFRDFGEAACETAAFLDRFWLTMVLKRADIIS